MQLPETVKKALAPALNGSVQQVTPVGGGCIANSCQVVTDRNVYFLKWGEGQVAASFVAEAKGLRALRQAKAPLHIPKVLQVAPEAEETPGFLLLEWVEAGLKNKQFWERFGRGLAQMHRHTASQYGFEQANFIGSLPQVNKWKDHWPTFFWENRLEPQVRIAKEKGRWNNRWNRHLNRLSNRLGGWLPDQPAPSMLHGDLWSGNVMTDKNNAAVLIDPAVYYGHRETDLAMTELFGGFDHRFYAAYREAWPLEDAYVQRRDLYNLYHLMNHLNHFGSGYADSVETLLRRYG